MKRVIYILSLFFISILIAIFFYLNQTLKVKHNYNLPSNNIEEIVRYLNSKDIPTNFIDKLILSYLKPQKGWVYINKKELKRYKFLIAISRERNRYKKFTIVPGETTYFIFKNMHRELGFDINKLKQYYNKYKIYKEGNFLANTYHIPSYFKEEEIIKLIINMSIKDYKKIAKINNIDFKDFKKYIIIASILEKEAANRDEMPLIASVIYNRLKKGMRLQVDGALNYGKYSHTKITPQIIRDDNSTYNTYKHKGLPKEPVCNVSLNALNAAIHPAITNYLYFFKKDNKSHYFSKTFKEHRRNIERKNKEAN